MGRALVPGVGMNAPDPEDRDALHRYMRQRDEEAALRRSRAGVIALFAVLAVIAVVLVLYSMS